MLEVTRKTLRNVLMGYETGVDAHEWLKEPTAQHLCACTYNVTYSLLPRDHRMHSDM